MLWGYPVEFWDWLGIRAMFVGVFLGALALLISFASSFVLYRVSDVVQRQSNLVIESAKQETAKLQKAVQWRRLTPEQKAILLETLSGKTVEAHFLVMNRDDPEQAQFFTDIVNFFNENSIKHRMFFSSPTVAAQFLFPFDGVLSQIQEGGDSTFIDAFKKAGLITGRLGTGLTIFPPQIKEGIVIAGKPTPPELK